jgi:RNA-directed DNA polymerase
MKRKGNLIEDIASFDNLVFAHYRAKRGKSYKQEVLCFSENLMQNLEALQKGITSGSVKVGDYHYFTIYDPKERQICAASYPERVLHHALMGVCDPYFESYQITDSYATRKGKGTFKAVDRAWGFQKKFPFFLKLDVRKYFDSIDHGILLSLLGHRFKDAGLLAIFVRILDSYHTKPGKGLPIGNLTSQYFANYYLGLMDHWLKETHRVKAYVRYMDDFVIWHDDKAWLQSIAKEIIGFLETRLALTLKTCYVAKATNGLPFLGFRLFPCKKILSARSKKRYARKMPALSAALLRGDISQAQFQARATALNAFAEKAYSLKFMRNVLDKCNFTE